MFVSKLNFESITRSCILHIIANFTVEPFSGNRKSQGTSKDHKTHSNPLWPIQQLLRNSTVNHKQLVSGAKSGDLERLYKIMAIHSIAAKISQFGPKWWTHNIALSTASVLAWLKSHNCCIAKRTETASLLIICCLNELYFESIWTTSSLLNNWLFS